MSGDANAGPVRPGAPVKGLARIFRWSDLDQWPSADKSALVSVVVIGLVLYATGLLLYARSHAADVPFIDPHALEVQLRLTYLVLAMWVLLGLASVILRRRHGGLRFFEHAPVQLFSISNSLFAYLMGALTVPYGPVVLIG